MYEAPKLVRFGKFRDLTLQTCNPLGGPTKAFPTADVLFGTGPADNDGCPARS